MSRSEVVADATVTFASGLLFGPRGRTGGRSVTAPARLAALAASSLFTLLFRFLVGGLAELFFFFGRTTGFFFTAFFEVRGFFFFDFATGSPHPSGAVAKQLRGEPLNELITPCTAEFVHVDREVSIGYLMKYL